MKSTYNLFLLLIFICVIFKIERFYSNKNQSKKTNTLFLLEQIAYQILDSIGLKYPLYMALL